MDRLRLEITRERDFPSVTSSAENLHASLAKYSMENKKYSANQWRKDQKEKKQKQQREYYERHKEVNITTPAFSSRMAKKRAKDKVSPSLPQTPAKKAEILQNLASTPRTRKILEKKKFVRPVEEQQNI